MADPMAELTLRQLQILARIAQGKPNLVIAKELGLSVKTVKAHVTGLFRVLGVSNRTSAAMKYVRRSAA